MSHPLLTTNYSLFTFPSDHHHLKVAASRDKFFNFVDHSTTALQCQTSSLYLQIKTEFDFEVIFQVIQDFLIEYCKKMVSVTVCCVDGGGEERDIPRFG